MKRYFIHTCAVAVAGNALLSGCSTPKTGNPVTVTRTGEIFVREQPPPLKTVAMGGAPDQDEVWVPGFWTYQNARWIWMPSHWQVPPQSGEAWIEGHWDRNNQGWVYTPGHWE